MCCRQLSVSVALLAVSQPHHVSPCHSPVGLAAAAVAVSRSCRQTKKNAGVFFFLFFIFYDSSRSFVQVAAFARLTAASGRLPPGLMGTMGGKEWEALTAASSGLVA